MSRKYKLIGLFIAAIFFFLNIPLIPAYGLNWDEPGHYIRGQAYIRFFLTGKQDYSDLPKLAFHYPKSSFSKLPKDIKYQDDSQFRRSIYQYDGRTFRDYVEGINPRLSDGGHPPLNDELASLFNLIFYQKLGIFPDIESYHLFVVLVSLILVGVVFFWTSKEYGLFAGIVTALSISLYPLFFSESHFNVKDSVEAGFYSLTVYAFYKGVVENNSKWILACALFSALALGTKFNILFAPATLISWLIIYRFEKIKRLKSPLSRNLTFGIFLIPVISSVILFASWPYLWRDPARIFKIFSYYKDIGFTTTYQPKEFIFLGISTYPFQLVLFITPLVVLFLSLFGIIYALKKGFSEKHKASILILLWFLVPVARVSLPNSGIYGGARQIMEYIPAMAMLSGIGARYIVTLLNGYIVKHFKQFSNVTIKQLKVSIKPLFPLQLLIVLSFIPIALRIISIHPNQNAYFNPLIGGLKGAKEENFPDWGVTLGSVYQQGVDWLNENAKQGANLALVRGLYSNIPRIKLRRDINFDNRYYSGEGKKGEYVMEVVDYNWDMFVPEEKRKYLENLESVYEVKVDEVSILKIWKNDFKYIRH